MTSFVSSMHRDLGCCFRMNTYDIAFGVWCPAAFIERASEERGRGGIVKTQDTAALLVSDSRSSTVRHDSVAYYYQAYLARLLASWHKTLVFVLEIQSYLDSYQNNFHLSILCLLRERNPNLNLDSALDHPFLLKNLPRGFRISYPAYSIPFQLRYPIS